MSRPVKLSLFGAATCAVAFAALMAAAYAWPTAQSVDAAALDGVLADLAARDLVTPGPPPALTTEGAALLERAGARVAALRARTVDGVSAEDYATVLRVLERLVANLEARPDTGPLIPPPTAR